MELELKKITNIFIEESVITEQGFFNKLKEILTPTLKDPNVKVNIIMDKNINSYLDSLKKNLYFKQAYLFEGTIDILTYYNLLQLIETKSYLETEELEKTIRNHQDINNYFITQKESIYKTFKKIKTTIDLSILKFEGTSFVEWKEAKKSLKAFYLENDDYIYKVDTKDLDYVYSPKYGYLRLDLSSEKSGGEGSVFKTYSNLMAKVYKQDNITYVNYKKLTTMLDMNIYNPYICWPKDLLYYKNHFIGYIMDEITDATTLLTLRLENFSEFTHLDRFKLCYNLLKNISYLHEKDILIGDLKPDNILVKSPEDVYFIDCGCYQIEDYSCPVCHPEYTKRVFKKDEIKKQLRTLEDEYYPINKLAFEILIRKNHTYSPNNLDIENQDKTQFYYPLDVSKVKPESEDMAIWCFLTQSMREYFYYYFKEGRITDLKTWCNELKLFIDKMKSMMNS